MLLLRSEKTTEVLVSETGFFTSPNAGGFTYWLSVGDEGMQSLHNPDILHALIPYYAPVSLGLGFRVTGLGSRVGNLGLGRQFPGLFRSLVRLTAGD